MSPTDLLPIADLSASETKAITAKDLLEGVVINMDAGSIPAAKIDFSGGIASGSINITQGDVVLGRTTGAGRAEEIACTLAGRALLAGVDATAQRTSLGLGTLAIRSGSWVDGSSFSGTSSGTNTGDQTITLTGPVTGSGTGTFATSLAVGGVTTAALADGAVTSAKLAPKGVAASNLDDQSSVVVGTGAPSGAGAFVGQGAFATGTGYAYTYTGTGWVQHAGVQQITGTDNGTPFSITVTGGATTDIALGLDPQAANAVWAGPATGAAASPSFRVLVSADLPVATAGAAGAVRPGTGMSVDAAGMLSHALGSAAAAGVLKVPGPDLAVNGTGELRHVVSPLTAGSYTKVTTDSNGHVVAGQKQLNDADIASVDASKLTGVLPATAIGPHTITRQMLADFSFAYIQEGIPPLTGHAIGTVWLQESTGQVSIWNGNSWMKTGASTLFNRNLRYGGSYNAATGIITGVTQFGTAEGLKVGDTIPAGDDKIAGLYFVASTGGASSSLAGGAVFDAGDWLLCHGTSAGWVRIDTLSGAGGGGGGGSTVSNLDDLLDVTLTSPTNSDFLQLNSSGQWVNVSVLDEGAWT